MSDEELEVLITLDDPVELPEEDTFNHLQAHNVGYWLGRQYPTWNRPDSKETHDVGGLQE